MKVECVDFRSVVCPGGAALVFADPPYNLKKVYLEGDDSVPYHHWVYDILQWSRGSWILLLGPSPTLQEWLPLVPKPDYMLWWHRTFLLPGRNLSFFAPSLTPILVYRNEGAQWYGPTRPDREFHDVIDRP